MSYVLAKATWMQLFLPEPVEHQWTWPSFRVLPYAQGANCCPFHTSDSLVRRRTAISWEICDFWVRTWRQQGKGYCGIRAESRLLSNLSFGGRSEWSESQEFSDGAKILLWEFDLERITWLAPDVAMSKGTHSVHEVRVVVAITKFVTPFSTNGIAGHP